MKRVEHLERPVLLRPSTFAAKADVSLSMAYKLISSGALPSVRMGRSVRVPEAALLAWIERNTTGGDVA